MGEGIGTLQIITSLFSPELYQEWHLLALILLLLLGVLGLIKGSRFIIFGASKVARILHISDYLIGITVVAFSTSLPEFFISVRAALKGDGVIALGNVIGSNIFNITLIFMILCIFAKEIFKVNWKNILFLTVLNIVLFALSAFNVQKIPRIMGLIFLIMLIFMIYTSYKNQPKENQERSTSENSSTSSFATVLIAIIELILGAGLLYVGSEIFLNSAKAIGYQLQIPNQIISIIVVAIGTSLPELMVTITSIYYMKKGNVDENLQDMAEGNIIGSNLFNILGVLGLTTLISSVEGVGVFLVDIVVMSLLTLMLFILMYQKVVVQKILGYIFLISFLAYLTILLI